MSLVLADTSVWVRIRQPSVGPLLAAAAKRNVLAMVGPIALEILRSARDTVQLEREAQDLHHLNQIPVQPPVVARALQVQAALARRGYHRGPSSVDLLAAAAAESVGAELWHCDRHFELIRQVTGQPMRKVGR